MPRTYKRYPHARIYKKHDPVTMQLTKDAILSKGVSIRAAGKRFSERQDQMSEDIDTHPLEVPEGEIQTGYWFHS